MGEMRWINKICGLQLLGSPPGRCEVIGDKKSIQTIHKIFHRTAKVYLKFCAVTNCEQSQFLYHVFCEKFKELVKIGQKSHKTGVTVHNLRGAIGVLVT